MFFIFILLCVSISQGCDYGMLESADGESDECVENFVVLLGGSNLGGWKSDNEIWGPDGKFADISIADFPYKLDAPFGWWRTSDNEVGHLLVCGGKNWSDDVTETRCWKYNPCHNIWIPDINMAVAASGGASITSLKGDLWAVGGGNGTAIGVTQVLRRNSSNWTLGPNLSDPRFGHCVVTINEGHGCVIVGGHNGENVVDVVEYLDLDHEVVIPVPGVIPPRPRWGGVCIARGEEVLVMGGMDEMFLSHSNVDILGISTYSWTKGDNLPWSQSGALGSVLGGQPTIWGGFGLGFQRKVASLSPQSDNWQVWEEKLEGSRTSGYAVAVPSDLFNVC